MESFEKKSVPERINKDQLAKTLADALEKSGNPGFAKAVEFLGASQVDWNKNETQERVRQIIQEINATLAEQSLQHMRGVEQGAKRSLEERPQ